jgi:hypothetical protein
VKNGGIIISGLYKAHLIARKKAFLEKSKEVI